MSKKINKSWVLLIVALILILGGSLLAGWINTGAGAAVVKNIRYAGTNGFTWNAMLYIPDGVTNENPAPAMMIAHGNDESLFIIANTSLEFARRGYVVLSIDMSGCGYSDVPSGSYRSGGGDALGYLRSLDIVDTNNIGLLGMSAGGGAVGGAADTYPDGYNSIFYMDSNFQFPNPEAMIAPAEYRNVMLNWGRFDEYATRSFGVGVTSQDDILSSQKITSTFGVTGTAEANKIYGSIEDGTARIIRLTNDTHCTTLDSFAAIGNAIEWMQMTTSGGNRLPSSNQIWIWRDVGSFSALIGAMLSLFAMGALLLNVPFFKDLGESTPEFKGFVGKGWWIGAVITIIVGPLLHHLLFTKSQKLFTTSALWPQSQTNGYMGVSIAVGIVSVILVLFNHFVFTRKNKATAVNYGLTWEGKGLDWKKIGKSLLLAICILLPLYLILLLVMNTLKVDFRLGTMALRVMSIPRFKAFLGYLIPFTFLYFAFTTVLNGFMRFKGGKASLAKEMIVTVLLWASGIWIWYFLHYVPLFFAGGVMDIDMGSTVLRAWPLIFLWPTYASLSTYFFRKTGHIYVGAFLIGILATWYIAAQSTMNVLTW
jgi:pimeloyl-ACP methyl ester carboxylesterase